jgi:altronate hydrolase
MPENVLQLDARDNVLVALTNLNVGDVVRYGSAANFATCAITTAVPAKHKMALVDLKPGDLIFCTAWWWAKRLNHPRGGVLTTRNIRHRAGAYTAERQPVSQSPRPMRPRGWSRTFMGYHRADGQVGTRNYWIVLPLVFCENRNVDQMREALEEELGYGSQSGYRQHVRG